MIKKIIFSLFSLLFLTQPMQAELLGFDFNFLSGYRQDSLTEKSDFGKSKLKTNGIYQIGVKGQLTFLNFFILGRATTGWACNGTLSESLSCLKLQSRLKNGRVNDWSAGLGYYFNVIPLCDWVRIGPMLGWSFDDLASHSHHSCSETYDSLKYHSTWKGPWAGLDFAFQFCEFSLHASYEYHWARFEARRNFKGLSLLDGPLESNHAHGQVLTLEGKWNFNLCWYLGLELRVQEWQANKGHWRHAAHCLGFLSSFEENKESKWRSFSLCAEVGVSF